MREIPPIIKKKSKICAKFHQLQKKQSHKFEKITVFVHKFWGEDQKKKNYKIREKTAPAHKFWGNNWYFGGLRPERVT